MRSQQPRGKDINLAPGNGTPGSFASKQQAEPETTLGDVAPVADDKPNESATGGFGPELYVPLGYDPDQLALF